MKYFILFFFIFSSSISFSQNLFGVNPAIGYFIDNSENDLQLLKKRNLYEYYVFGISYETSMFFDYNILIDYSYSKSTRNGVIKALQTNQYGEPIVVHSLDYYLLNHNIDILLLFGLYDSGFRWGIGPAFVITNRSLNFPKYFNDVLASSGVGICTTIESIPIFGTTQDLYSARFFGKARYTQSVWFDKGIRKLDSYKQHFFDSAVGIRFLFNLNQL